jgi:hypothetical protein
MARRAARRKVSGDFILGSEQAENDPLLDTGFYENAISMSIESRINPHCFVIGRTGSGKSAMLRHLEDTQPDHVVRITPQDLSLPYILELDVIKTLSAMDVHLDAFFTALWKHVLIVEVIRHRYHVTSSAAKQNFFDRILSRVANNPSKKQALEYLNEFGASFWCETDQRVREVIERFERELRVGASAGASGGLIPISATLTAGAHNSNSTEIRTQEADRYQRIVNRTQLARLNKMIRVLDEDILDSDQHFTYVLIDDLDRDWVNERLANDLIRCLFGAVLDLQSTRRLKLVVALRTNIFEYLDFGARTGGQEEKFRALELEVTWGRDELKELADARAYAAGQLWHVPDIAGIGDLLPSTSSRRRQEPLQYIIDRTLLRPRDLIAFVNEAIQHSGGARLTWKKLYEAEPIYSRKRLLPLRDEWKPTFPGIDTVFDCFQKAELPLNRAAVTRILGEVALLPAREDFRGVRWVTELTAALWGSLTASWVEEYQPLIRLLYQIGFLGIIPSGERDPIYSYSQPEYAVLATNVESASAFTVHPAFRPALDIGPVPGSTKASQSERARVQLSEEVGE